jgi:23S rRNA pseudouridine2457 synthase
MKKLVYLAFYKPYGILSQFTSEKPNETLSIFNLPKDVYACGRLDKDSEGLLLLTNDGPLIEKMLNPKNEKEKTYWVQVEKIPTEKNLEKLRAGVLIGDYLTKPCKVKILDPQPEVNPRIPPIRVRLTIPTCWLEIIITEGKNRQVRKMTAAVGYPTLRLLRKQIGMLTLSGLLEGEYREINRDEIFK